MGRAGARSGYSGAFYTCPSIRKQSYGLLCHRTHLFSTNRIFPFAKQRKYAILSYYEEL